MGGFVMSDGTEATVSPTRLSEYLYCPRKYDFNYDQSIETPDRSKRYLQQGQALHTTIEWTCKDVDTGTDPTTIHEAALEYFSEAWEHEVEREEFASDAHYEYFQRLARAGISSYFDPEGGPGIEHARRSVAVERELRCDHKGVPLHGYADSIVREDGGLHVIDYKRNLRGMLTSGTADRLAGHLDGEEHEAKRVKNAMQTAVYLEGVKTTDLYSEGMDVRFSFYGLLHKTDAQTGPAGYSVTASGHDREMTEIYADHYDTIWRLIQGAYEGITTQQYEPEPWTLIREEACGDCAYQAMCPEYLGAEVRIE